MAEYAKKSRRSVTSQSLRLFFEHDKKNEPREGWIAGRIIGILEDGFVLQEGDERIDLVYGGRVNPGDIVEAFVTGGKEVLPDGKEVALYTVREFAVLTPCRDEFFIRKE
ncbi:MAG TPA: hypothetical protein VI588_03330, partial [Candidatus Gracilibacteria bacterium]|nr:hypothetical protein [Candidatus Gracilibacteria bacterium]